MNFKKWLATLLLAIGIIGFFINTEQKGDKQVFSERISNTDKHLLKVEIENGHHYEFKFWGVDEEMTNTFSQPNFAANIQIFNSQNDLLFSEELISIHQTETGGKLVTHNGFSYMHDAISNETIQLALQITDGDYMDIEAYKDLSTEDDAMPGIFIIIAIIGLVLYLRSNKKS